MDAAITAIKCFIQIDDRTGCAGQPTAEQFKAVRDAGFEAVVNLLPSEQDNALKNEDALIRDLGMESLHPCSMDRPATKGFCGVLRSDAKT